MLSSFPIECLETPFPPSVCCSRAGGDACRIPLAPTPPGGRTLFPSTPLAAAHVSAIASILNEGVDAFVPRVALRPYRRARKCGH